MELSTMSCANATLTMLITNSPVSMMFFAVSFGEPSDRFPGANATIGGLVPKTLKKEKGARLVTPVDERVETQAMGLGDTTAVRMR